MAHDQIEMKRLLVTRKTERELGDTDTAILTEIVRAASPKNIGDRDSFDDKYTDPKVVDPLFKGRRLQNPEGYRLAAATNILTKREGLPYVLGLWDQRLPKSFCERVKFFFTSNYLSLN